MNAEGGLIEFAVRRRDWSLNVQQLCIGKAIGKGEFGLIYKARLRRLFALDKKAVVKVLQNADSMDRFEKCVRLCTVETRSMHDDVEPARALQGAPVLRGAADDESAAPERAPHLRHLRGQRRPDIGAGARVQ